MSIKRYRFFGQVQEVGESGETIDAGWSVFHPWIKYEDYAALLADNEAYKKQHESDQELKLALIERQRELRGEIKSLVDEVARLLAEPSWRPIETAPKDEEILVWNKEMKRRAWTVIWSDEFGFVSSQTQFPFKHEFTHWTPIPKPPSL